MDYSSHMSYPFTSFPDRGTVPMPLAFRLHIQPIEAVPTEAVTWDVSTDFDLQTKQTQKMLIVGKCSQGLSYMYEQGVASM